MNNYFKCISIFTLIHTRSKYKDWKSLNRYLIYKTRLILEIANKQFAIYMYLTIINN